MLERTGTPFRFVIFFNNCYFSLFVKFVIEIAYALTHSDEGEGEGQMPTVAPKQHVQAHVESACLACRERARRGRLGGSGRLVEGSEFHRREPVQSPNTYMGAADCLDVPSKYYQKIADNKLSRP